MGMTIDEALNLLNNSKPKSNNAFSIQIYEAIYVIDSTIRKYQKIKNIVRKWEDGLFDDEGVLDVEVLEMISDEVCNGNDD